MSLILVLGVRAGGEVHRAARRGVGPLRDRHRRLVPAGAGEAIPREAARRAGINVRRIRILAFVFCSSMAAISGLLAASYTGMVSPGPYVPPPG